MVIGGNGVAPGGLEVACGGIEAVGQRLPCFCSSPASCEKKERKMEWGSCNFSLCVNDCK